MRGLAIIGGEGPAPEALAEAALEADILAAADSGLIAAEAAGLRPDWILGDMDSLDDTGRLCKYPAERVLRFPVAKDYTDTEIAVMFLREKGCGEIWLAGGGGGRIDHLLAIHSLFERDNPPDRWFPGAQEVRLLKEGTSAAADLPAGSIVSVFPAGKEGWEAESRGLTWPLDGLSWERGAFSVSNTAEGGPVSIRSLRGRFIVILPMMIGGKAAASP